MKRLHVILVIVASLAFLREASGQGFVNLNFEASVVTSSQPAWWFAGNYGMANMPGWTEFNGWGDSNYIRGASVIYNNQTLDSPNVSLWDKAYPNPAIQGNFSVYLYGGSVAYADEYPQLPTGASISQTGQIPVTARSITYWGDGLQVTFNGHMLSFVNIGNTTNYTVWSADISAFAGQSGELVFAAPYQYGGRLDNIQFSQVPEPNELGLLSTAMIFLLWRMKRPKHWRQRAPRVRTVCIAHQWRGGE